MTLADLDPEFVAAYEEAMFDDDHRAMIAQALGGIDDARRNLIAAQNELHAVLGGTSDYARRVFASFYSDGMVTRADWMKATRKRVRHERSPSTPPRRNWGQLRVVVSDTSGTDAVAGRGVRGEGDAPDARPEKT